MERNRRGRRPERTATMLSLALHVGLAVVLWGTVSLAALPAEPVPLELVAKIEAAAPVVTPPPPPPPADRPPPVSAEPVVTEEVAEAPPEDLLPEGPLFDDPAERTPVANPIAPPSRPCRAVGFRSSLRRPPAAPAPAPAPRPRRTDAPAGPTKNAAPAAGNAAPVYPARAASAGVEGVVVLLVRVSADGTVSDVEVRRSSGSALLDGEAIRAVRRWRFTPARERGVKVADAVEVPIRFELR